MSVMPKENSPALSTKLVKDLAEILNETELGEIEVEHGELRIRLSKGGSPVVAAPAPVSNVMVPPQAPAPAAAPQTAEAPSVVPVNEDAPSENTVTSPMVGTAYLSPEPGAAAFITEGAKVKEGDTLLLVEAMKTFNPVTAPRSGTITKIIINDTDPVEFGQPLLVLE